jgi:hypothetical protein
MEYSKFAGKLTYGSFDDHALEGLYSRKWELKVFAPPDKDGRRSKSKPVAAKRGQVAFDHYSGEGAE